VIPVEEFVFIDTGKKRSNQAADISERGRRENESSSREVMNLRIGEGALFTPAHRR
jgi:hypothetical protein